MFLLDSSFTLILQNETVMLPSCAVYRVIWWSITAIRDGYVQRLVIIHKEGWWECRGEASMG